MASKPEHRDADDAAERAEEVKDGIQLVTTAANYPTVFADGCLYATCAVGLVRLTFVETILEAADSPHPGAKTRHVGTLVMPETGFQSTLKYLNDLDAVWSKRAADDTESKDGK